MRSFKPIFLLTPATCRMYSTTTCSLLHPQLLDRSLNQKNEIFIPSHSPSSPTVPLRPVNLCVLTFTCLICSDSLSVPSGRRIRRLLIVRMRRYISQFSINNELATSAVPRRTCPIAHSTSPAASTLGAATIMLDGD